MRQVGPVRREHPSGCLPLPGHPIEERHVEAAVRHMARLVLQYGEVLVPLFERFEADLVEIRRRKSPMDRARAILDAHTIDDSRPGGSIES